MYELRRSKTFDAWLANLNGSNARARIAARIDRLALGNPGDVKPVGGGVREMRIDYGPGIACITRARGALCICCSAVALRLRRKLISKVRSK